MSSIYCISYKNSDVLIIFVNNQNSDEITNAERSFCNMLEIVGL